MKILFVDDRWEEDLYAQFYGERLRPHGIEVLFEADGGRTLSKLEADEEIRLLLLDLMLEGQEQQGQDILKEVIERFGERIPVIILTQVDQVSTAVECMKRGAYYYFTKPSADHRLDLNQLTIQIQHAVQYTELSREIRSLKSSAMQEMVGQSSVLREVKRLIEKIAPEKVDVLIMGETGTGKELAAKAIHELSPRKDKPFVPVNCPSLSETIIESELFGHERGAFTGAISQRIGRFERASHGTVFLDEIGELSLATQAKLLRVLEAREINRVGNSMPFEVDIRVVAATNRNLPEEVEKRAFREDLFYRLNAFPIHLPPLRERKEDIPLLVRAFIDEFNREHDHRIIGIDPAAEAFLVDYGWPGNIRQLRACIQRTVVISAKHTEYLLPSDFAPNLDSTKPPAPSPADGSSLTVPRSNLILFPQSMQEIERHAIQLALTHTEGNKTQAAKLLSISISTLNRKAKKYEIILSE